MKTYISILLLLPVFAFGQFKTLPNLTSQQLSMKHGYVDASPVDEGATVWERLAWFNGAILVDATLDAIFYPAITNNPRYNQNIIPYRIIQFGWEAIEGIIVYDKAGLGTLVGVVSVKLGGGMDGLYYPLTSFIWGGYYRGAWSEQIMGDQATWLSWTFAKWGTDPKVPIGHQAFINEMIITYAAGTLTTILFDQHNRFTLISHGAGITARYSL